MTFKFDLDWTTFKAELASRKSILQYIELTSEYWVYFLDGGVMFRSDIAKDAGADQTDFDDNYKATANKPLEFRSLYGKPITATVTEGTKVSFVSHDFCNACSWWQNATKVLAETLTDSGDGLTFTFANTDIIDADCISERDRIYETPLLDANVMHIVDNFKRFYKIQIDASETTTGFTMDFAAGTVTFDSSQSGNTVTADYYYATTADYKIEPTTGKKIRLERAEAQFTDILPPRIIFEVHYQHPTYGDIVVSSRTYVSMQDFLNESNGGGNKVDQIRFEAGGAGLYDVFTLFWDYNAPIELADSADLWIIVKPMTASDVPITGKMATFTFYALSEDE